MDRTPVVGHKMRSDFKIKMYSHMFLPLAFQGFSMRANSVSTGAEVAELRTSDRELRLPDPEVSSAVCTKSAREQLVCRVLLTGGDDSVHLMQQGGMWRYSQ